MFHQHHPRHNGRHRQAIHERSTHTLSSESSTHVDGNESHEGDEGPREISNTGDRFAGERMVRTEMRLTPERSAEAFKYNLSVGNRHDERDRGGTLRKPWGNLGETVGGGGIEETLVEPWGLPW